MAAHAADAGFASGDLMYACFNNSAHVIYLAYGGRPLSDVMDLARRNYARNGRRVLNAAYHCVLQLQIAKAKYVTEGPNTYPDATFTLRLAFGLVKGYQENGKPVPAFTDFAGAYVPSKEHGHASCGVISHRVVMARRRAGDVPESPFHSVPFPRIADGAM